MAGKQNLSKVCFLPQGDGRILPIEVLVKIVTDHVLLPIGRSVIDNHANIRETGSLQDETIQRVGNERRLIIGHAADTDRKLLVIQTIHL